jgi:meiosis-specific protein
VAVKVIKRDLSIEGNTLLDWIEKGCFDALEKQYLATLVFGIYLDPNDPTDLAECYYFHFNYPSATSNYYHNLRLFYEIFY